MKHMVLETKKIIITRDEINYPPQPQQMWCFARRMIHIVFLTGALQPTLIFLALIPNVM